jgi:hypothetical protein
MMMIDEGRDEDSFQNSLPIFLSDKILSVTLH